LLSSSSLTRILAFLCPLHREVNGHPCELSLHTFEGEAATMFGEDFVGYVKPQSSALAQWLGGKERLDNHGNLIRRDSHAAIEKGYVDILPGVDTHAFAADVDFQRWFSLSP